MSVVYIDDKCVLFDLKNYYYNLLYDSIESHGNEAIKLKNINTSVSKPYFGVGKKFGPQSRLKFEIILFLRKLKCVTNYFIRINEENTSNGRPLKTEEMKITNEKDRNEFNRSLLKMKKSHSFENKYKTSIVIEYKEKPYVFPPYSIFCMCDLFKLNFNNYLNGVFDFIIVDPPWTNKSVRRSARYDSSYDLTLHLTKLPIIKLLNKKSGFVFVWVTNSERIQRFVLRQLLPKWNLVALGCFVYVKLTTNGDPIFDVDSTHRQPYEYCIVCGVEDRNISMSNNKAKQSCNELPIIKYFFMIQPSIHSLKPPLSEFLKIWCPGNCGRIMELFSRYPAPNTISFGNELIEIFEYSASI